jgi:dTDP-glucose pyrophosphorylase
MIDWRNLLVRPDDSIKKTMEVIDLGRERIAFVVDERGALLGTVTDGDIRRGLLKGLGLDGSITEAMHTAPVHVVDGQTRWSDLLTLLRKNNIQHLPIVDEERRLLRVETLESMMAEGRRDNAVVLMAGGRGKRLYPLTEDIPKALVTVGDRPILETILLRIAEEGFRRFYISVNYKAEMIEAHFGDGRNFGVQIDYLREDRQLGTAGALSLLPEQPRAPLLVMNCDVLTKVRFTQLFDFHAEQGAAATMAVREIDFQVPYGVVRLEEQLITAIDEKPTQRFFVNAGIYVLEPQAVKLIPRDEPFDMPSLFQLLINKEKRRCAAYPVCEYWIDVGQVADLRRAQGDYSGVFKDS